MTPFVRLENIKMIKAQFPVKTTCETKLFTVENFPTLPQQGPQQGPIPQ